MYKSIKIVTLCLLLCLATITQGYGRAATDTTKMISEFSQVMAFVARPNLYYTTITKMSAVPILQPQDTMSISGVFYKRGNNMYTANGPDEFYLQDSLLVQINHLRKSIWVNKVNAAAKEKMLAMPVISKQLDELFSKQYHINKTILNTTVARFTVVSKQQKTRLQLLTTTINLDYTLKDQLPVSMEIIMRLQQPLNDQLLAALKNETADYVQLVQTIDGTSFLVRTQSSKVWFSGMDSSAAKAAQLPALKTVFDYPQTTTGFSATAAYKDYEITKIF